MIDKERLFIDLSISVIDINKRREFDGLTNTEKIEVLKDACKNAVIDDNSKYTTISSKLANIEFWKDELLEELDIDSPMTLEAFNSVIYSFCQVKPLSNLFFAESSLYITKYNFDILNKNIESLLPKIYDGSIDLFDSQVYYSDSYLSFKLQRSEISALLEDVNFIYSQDQNNNALFVHDIFKSVNFDSEIIINKLL